MSMFRMIAVSCASLMLLGSSVLAEQVSNPEYEQWSKFKAGAMSKVVGETTTAGQASKQTMVTRLVEITPEKAVVEVSMKMEVMGNAMEMPAQKRDVPAKIEAATVPTTPPTPPANAEAKTSEETVKVGDKSVKCKIVETKMEQNGMTVVTKSWVSPEVPAQLVKSESKTSGVMESTTTMTLTEFTTGG